MLDRGRRDGRIREALHQRCRILGRGRDPFGLGFPRRRSSTRAIKAGATTLNVPDTVGYTTPANTRNLMAYLRSACRASTMSIISVHCHNDLGMATANTLAAIAAGARQAEVTVNGIGERAGNTALEEVVMALATRGEQFGGAYTNIRTDRIVPTSRAAQRHHRSRGAGQQGDRRRQRLRA